MAIFVSSYEMTIKEYGYPQDFMELVKWEYKDYLYWAVEWLPEKLLKRIKKNKQVINEDDDRQEHDEFKTEDYLLNGDITSRL